MHTWYVPVDRASLGFNHTQKDTWATYPGQASEQSRVTHGTFFYLAQEEGLISNHSIHAGIRCKLTVCVYVAPYSHILYLFPKGVEDLAGDEAVGFQVISTDDIDDLGIPEIVRRIRRRISDRPVYLRYIHLYS